MKGRVATRGSLSDLQPDARGEGSADLFGLYVHEY